MKKPRHALAILLSLICLGTLLPACAKKDASGTTASPSQAAESTTDPGAETDAPDVPTQDVPYIDPDTQGGYQLPSDDAFYHSFTIMLGLPGETPSGSISYSYLGGEVVLNLRITTSSPTPAKLALVLLCDGVPTPFAIGNDTEKVMFMTADINRGNTVKITFTPEFASSFGRVSFAAIAAPDLNASPLQSTNTLTVSFDLPLDYWPNANPITETMAYTLPVHEFIGSFDSLADQKYIMRLSDAGVYDTLTDGDAWVPSTLTDSDEFLFEFYPKTPGDYRLVAMLDYEPFGFFNGDAIIDCRLNEDEMISYTGFVADFIPPGEHTFFIAAVRLDDIMLIDERGFGRWPVNFQYVTERFELVR